MDPAHSVMLTKEIAYTALTRARETCFVIGSREKAFNKAIRNARTSDRKSLLAHYLKQPKEITDSQELKEEQLKFN